eukprot:TRINITY_DN12299_c0_g2_i3.p1 TRINITY_DN12299_c0_g2~~TRINITY_DN12299_c0_g2_i3.p1  ORF type:complete len:585 (+),score=100.21 TRINITY_DN12299_c0_g2_i3:117-1871(+)
MGSGPDLLQRLQRQVRELFITRDSDPYAERLCLAAEDGSLEAMSKLLEKRSHPNVEDCTGERPLHIAVREGHIRLVRLLLERGADGESRNQDGLTPLQVAETLDNAFKRKEITTILGKCCGSPQSSQEPVRMGDDGDDESKYIREYKPSTHSTINEARSFEQEESISEDHENIEGFNDETQAPPPQLTSVDSVGLIIVMVGLPGRGKTYIARRLCRWLNWKGTRCRIFNVGKYRRDREKEESEDKAAYFDHKNQKAAAERELLAKRASEDLITYLTNNMGAVAIFDATNSTKDRRRSLVKQFSDILPSDRVIFIESVCTDEEVVHNNILRAKMGNDDYKDKEAAYVISDFKARIRMYEQVYQPLSIESDEDRSWVQLRNTISSHMGGHITVNRISGHLPTKLLYFLFNLRTTVAPVYLAPISSTNQLAASAAVRRFFQTSEHSYETLRVWSPPNQQAVESVAHLNGNSFLNRYYETLREIDRGECRGMTDDEIRKRMPDLYKERAEGGYSHAWPRGESFHDMNVRLEQIILDIHSSDFPSSSSPAMTSVRVCMLTWLSFFLSFASTFQSLQIQFLNLDIKVMNQ